VNGRLKTVGNAISSVGFICGLLTVAVQAQAAEIHLVTENYPPFNFMKDGEIVGLGADQVREIMVRENIEFTMEMLPWSRAFWLAENRKNHCVFTTAYTPARAETFAWISPLGGAELFLIKKAGSQILRR
jgi:polar amino acid transport system substrate-binding protein